MKIILSLAACCLLSFAAPATNEAKPQAAVASPTAEAQLASNGGPGCLCGLRVPQPACCYR